MQRCAECAVEVVVLYCVAAPTREQRAVALLVAQMQRDACGAQHAYGATCHNAVGGIVAILVAAVHEHCVAHSEIGKEILAPLFYIERDVCYALFFCCFLYAEAEHYIAILYFLLGGESPHIGKATTIVAWVVRCFCVHHLAHHECHVSKNVLAQ